MYDVTRVDQGDILIERKFFIDKGNNWEFAVTILTTVKIGKDPIQKVARLFMYIFRKGQLFFFVKLSNPQTVKKTVNFPKEIVVICSYMDDYLK